MINHESRITDHGSRITDHASFITTNESRITDHESPITPHPSRFTPQHWLIAFVLLVLLAGCVTDTPQPPGATAAATPAATPTASPEPGAWRTWPARRMSVEVRRIIVDAGQLWLTTSQGLVSIDPATLRYRQHTFTDPETGVSLGDMSLLVRDGDGRLWAGGRGLLRADHVRLNGELAWTPVLTQSYLYGFGLDAGGNFWQAFSMRHGWAFFRFPGDTPPRRGSWESELAMDPPMPGECEGWTMWASYYQVYGSPAECEAALARQARVEALMPQVSPDTPAPAHTLIGEDAHGTLWWTLWMQGGGQLLASYDGDAVHTLPWGSEMYVSALVGDPTGHGAWLVSDQGLFYSDGETVSQYVLEEGGVLAQRGPVGVRALAVTGGGTAWASTGDGLLRLDAWDGGWRLAVPRVRGLVPDLPIAVAAADAALWYAQAGTLQRIDEYQTHRWPFPPGLFDCPIHAMAVHEGFVRVAAGPCGIWRFEGGDWRHEAPEVPAVALVSGDDGRLYAQVALGNAPYVYEDGTWTRLSDPRWETLEVPVLGPTPVPPPASEAQPSPSPQPAPPLDANARPAIPIAVDAQGRVWGAGPTHVWRHNPGTGAWDDVYALPRGFVATALLLDARGALWVGGTSGALRCAEAACEDVSLGVALDSVTALAGDAQGRLWFGGPDGVAVYAP